MLQWCFTDNLKDYLRRIVLKHSYISEGFPFPHLEIYFLGSYFVTDFGFSNTTHLCPPLFDPLFLGMMSEKDVFVLFFAAEKLRIFCWLFKKLTLDCRLMRGCHVRIIWEDVQTVSDCEQPAPAVCVDAFFRAEDLRGGI